MLEFKNITVSYHQGVPVLKGINMHVAEGDRIALLGRNGAGKSTFANTIFGLVPIIRGSLTYNDADLRSTPLEKYSALGIGYFMQGAPVFPQMSVRENLLLSAGKANQANFNERLQELQPYLPILSADHLLTSFAGSLSGGERTQLALAMALFNRPGLLVLDEPFAGLSPSNSGLIMQALHEYHRSSGAAMILIAQDRVTASAFCGLHFVIRDGSVSRIS